MLTAVSDAAYSVLNERVAENASPFFVYEDADSGFNHGFPSGLFGAMNGPNDHKVRVKTDCVEDASVGGCRLI